MQFLHQFHLSTFKKVKVRVMKKHFPTPTPTPAEPDSVVQESFIKIKSAGYVIRTSTNPLTGELEIMIAIQPKLPLDLVQTVAVVQSLSESLIIEEIISTINEPKCIIPVGYLGAVPYNPGDSFPVTS